MFVYISLAIGSFPSKIHTGFLVGVAGIVLVVASILCSVGIMSFANVGLTMISVLFINLLHHNLFFN